MDKINTLKLRKIRQLSKNESKPKRFLILFYAKRITNANIPKERRIAHPNIIYLVDFVFLGYLIEIFKNLSSLRVV